MITYVGAQNSCVVGAIILYLLQKNKGEVFALNCRFSKILQCTFFSYSVHQFTDEPFSILQWSLTEP